MEYLHWDEQAIDTKDASLVSDMYDRGFLFTRKGRGVMQQTRSARINLEKFIQSSENRRVLKKGGKITATRENIPYSGYSWEIGKMAKDFYEEKAPRAFSVNKIRELISVGLNFNSLIEFKDAENQRNLGFVICYEGAGIIHYSYPFYDLESAPKDMGLFMMNWAISDAMARGLRYIYLGSLQRPTDTYKLQFSGTEWFDGKNWQTDTDEAKKVLK